MRKMQRSAKRKAKPSPRVELFSEASGEGSSEVDFAGAACDGRGSVVAIFEVSKAHRGRIEPPGNKLRAKTLKIENDGMARERDTVDATAAKHQSITTCASPSLSLGRSFLK